MRKIFVYGDSNVWGDNTIGPRVPYHLRWANRLRRSSTIRVIADGIPGRVAGDFRTDKPHKNGKTAYLESLNKAGEVDVTIIALGTNDLQDKYERTAQDVIDDLLWYQSVTKGPKILYLLPSLFATDDQTGPHFTQKSLDLRSEIVRHRSLLGWSLLPEEISLSDGLHFSVDGHKEVFQLVKQELENEL